MKRRAVPDRRIVVIDCGIGNLQSLLRGLKKAGGQAVASSAIEDVEAAERIVLPGVGSYAQGMDVLARHRLLPVLRHKVFDERTPVLGICLGHQMLAASSEEGNVAGLGWIDGETKRLWITPRQSAKVPHIGWNTLSISADCPLLRDVASDACFYFAHSYRVSCNNPDIVVATTRYGCDFVSVVHKDNVFGTQFHPEKSHANGITILKNFVEYA